MGHKLGVIQPDVREMIRDAITARVEGATTHVEGGSGHFTIEVVSPVFEGKNRVESQRLVLSAIAHLMAGDMAPVHAVDSLKTRAR